MNIRDIHNCYGCGLCAVVCSKKIINIGLNADGFYEPCITDQTKCTDCGLCADVCAFRDDEVEMPADFSLASYAAWSDDPTVRRKCSSGGIGFEVGRALIGQGYSVCGVRYNIELGRAEHFVASSLSSLAQTVGSKYIQSHTVEGFQSVSRKDKWLVTGTPCQIDSFRRYIKKFRCEENFVLMDFFCHGVPSMLMWEKYVSEREAELGKLTYVSWRNKFDWGWHDSWAMSIDGEKTSSKVEGDDSCNMLLMEKKGFYTKRWSCGDSFFRMFLGNACLGKACYDKCKYKMTSSAADIRIGDLWGSKYQSDEKGVSAVLAFTERGKEVLSQLNGCTMVPETVEVVTEGQMRESAKRPKSAGVVSFLLKTKTPLSVVASVSRVVNLLFSLPYRMKRILG